MTQETLAMTREDSDSRLMTCDLTWDSAPGKSNDSRLGMCDSGLQKTFDKVPFKRLMMKINACIPTDY